MKQHSFSIILQNLILLTILTITVQVQAADFYVSTKGSDDNPGTEERPFATIEKAKAAVRELKKTKTDCGITVLICGGIYNLDEPLTFTSEDSGTKKCPIVYQAYQDEIPILTGEIQIKGWQKLINEPNLVSSQASGKLWMAPVSTKMNFNQLFVNSKLMQRSITPNTDYTEIWPKGKFGKEYSQIIVDKEILKDRPDVSGAEINFLSNRWYNYLLPISSIEGNNISVKWPPKMLHLEQRKDFFPVRIENTLDGIDQPGEWCLDTANNLVYLWPPDNIRMKDAKITIPSSITAILMEGEEDQTKFVEHITLRGLVIEQVKNGINMTAVQNCTIDSCRIGPLNMTAIAATGHIQRVTISNCKIAECGYGGIGLHGGRMSLKNINQHNTIINNEIYNCGLINWHSSGIGIGGSSHNIIRQNHIHHTPYAAITIGGARFGILKIRMNENPDSEVFNGIEPADRTIYGLKKYVAGHNLVENNVIHDVMMRLEDGGAIYCHASQFNMLRNNVVYRSHTKFSFGLYFDDDEMYSTMENNLVYECPIEKSAESTSRHQGTGLYMHDNAKNYAYRNIVALTDKILWLLNNYGGIRIMDNVFVVKRDGIDPDKLPRNIGRYRYMDIKWDAGENIMDNNVYWCIDGNDAAMEYLKKWQEKGWDKNSIVANPGFKNIEKRDFSFDTTSVAWQMGIRPIDKSKVGIQSNLAAVK